MAGNIFNLAKRDAKRIVTSLGWQETIELSTPSKDLTLSLTGFATKHWINYDSDGNPVDSKNAHVCIDESFLVLNDYPVRNNRGEIALKNHIVAFPDSSGVVRTYVVRRNLPDETLGLIVLILGDYNDD